MRPVQSRSPWIDRFPKSRVPSYPKHRGEMEVEVTVIGGGLTGCAVAYAFAAAGARVALFEADRVGRGSSGSSAGWITEEPPASFLDITAALGRRAARHAWQSWRKAALDFEALICRLDIKCAVQSRSVFTIAQTADQAERLAREHKARRAAGLGTVLIPASRLDAITGFPARAGIISKDNQLVDPYRLTLGLAAAAVNRGARIFERSPVTKTTFTRESATVALASGSVRAARVIVATGAAGALFKPLARHLSHRTAYLALTGPVPAKVRRALGSRDHLLRDSAEPAHRIAWVDDERLLVSGADGGPVPKHDRDTLLVQRTGQLMYELSTFYPEISGLLPEYGWDAPYCLTSHGLPIIGPHRNFPHHLFVLGGAVHSLTGAYLASRLLLRHHQDELQAADKPFRFPL